jgi:hypothetical protein
MACASSNFLIADFAEESVIFRRPIDENAMTDIQVTTVSRPVCSAGAAQSEKSIPSFILMASPSISVSALKKAVGTVLGSR